MKSEKVKPVSSVVIGIVCFVLLTIFDQLTKRWAVSHLCGKDPIVLIPDVFQLRYLENQGAAFGMMQGRRALFVLLAVIVLAVIAWLYARIPFVRKYRILRVLMVFIASGAVGNFIDRISQGYVVDFFYFNLIHFPIFNVADVFVTVSVIVLVVDLIFWMKEDDYDEITSHLGFSGKRDS